MEAIPTQKKYREQEPTLSATNSRIITEQVNVIVPHVDVNTLCYDVNIGTTAFSRFADYHDLPEAHTLWKYWIYYITRDGLQIGQQSTCDATVQGRVGR